MKIDELDMKIVQLLKQNGRIQNNEIASRLSVSEGTVRNRIKKLIDQNFLVIKGLINPDMVKDKEIVFLGVSMSTAKGLEETAERISNLPNVLSVHMVTGRYDLIVETYIEPSHLVHFLGNDLGTIESIAATESFISLKAHKKWI